MCVSTGMTIRVHPFSHGGGVCLRQAWLNSGGLFREQDSEGITRANTRLRVRSRRQALRLSFCPEVWLVFQVQRLHHGLWADGKREELHHAGPALPGGAAPPSEPRGDAGIIPRAAGELFRYRAGREDQAGVRQTRA